MNKPAFSPHDLRARSTSKRSFFAKLAAMAASLMKVGEKDQASKFLGLQHDGAWHSGKKARRGTPGAFGHPSAKVQLRKLGIKHPNLLG
jgi:hypothetical protein